MFDSKLNIVVLAALATILFALFCFFMKFNFFFVKELYGFSYFNWTVICFFIVFLFFFIKHFIKIGRIIKETQRLGFKVSAYHKAIQVLLIMLWSTITYNYIMLIETTPKPIPIYHIIIFIIFCLVLMFFVFHTIINEGFGEKGVYFWGFFFKWNEIEEYNVIDDRFEIVVYKKIFFHTYEIILPYHNIEDIEELVDYVIDSL